MPEPTAMKSPHHELLDVLMSLNQWWPDSSQENVAALNAREVMLRLADLRRLLKEEFDAEERNGLLPNDATITTAMEQQSERLLHEHEDLLAKLNAVISSVPLLTEQPHAWEVAKRHFDNFQYQLKCHEHAEIKLLQTAVGDLLGVGD